MKVIGTDFKEYTIEPRADLSEAYLEDADLRWASLRGANLYRAYLIRTDLREANLSGLFGMVRLSFQKDLRFLKEWDLDC
jgi:uncharacterized protein YjbI with pentapeptide repeats